MGQCPIRGETEVTCTEQHQQSLHLSNAPITCKMITTTCDYIALPRWCFRNPNVTSSMAELIRTSWSAAIDDSCHVQIDVLNRDMSEEESDMLESLVNKRISIESKGKAETGSLVKKNSVANKYEAQQMEEESPIHCPMVHISSPIATTVVSNGANSPPPLRLSSPKNQITTSPKMAPHQYLKSRRVVFYEILLKQWSLYDMNFGVVFKNMKDTVDVVSRMMSFLVNNCERLDDPELTIRIRKVAMAHNRANVPIESYDALASSTMIALKRLLGSEFTFDTKEAWMMLFSKFFHLVFPLTKPPETIKIKCNTEPGL